MPVDLTQRMQDWRDGLLSNSEILNYLLMAQGEIVKSMWEAEIKQADERLAKLEV